MTDPAFDKAMHGPAQQIEDEAKRIDDEQAKHTEQVLHPKEDPMFNKSREADRSHAEIIGGNVAKFGEDPAMHGSVDLELGLSDGRSYTTSLHAPDFADPFHSREIRFGIRLTWDPSKLELSSNGATIIAASIH